MAYVTKVKAIADEWAELVAALDVGDDPGVIAWLDHGAAGADRRVGILAGLIAFNGGRFLAGLCVLPAADPAATAAEINALGLTLLASRSIDGYLVRAYDQLRTPSQQFAAGKDCARPCVEFVPDFMGAESLPLVLVVAFPARGAGSITDKLNKLEMAVTQLRCTEDKSLWLPPSPLPVAVEEGRATWLARQATNRTINAEPPWGYSVSYPDGTRQQGECIYSHWPGLSRVLSSTSLTQQQAK